MDDYDILRAIQEVLGVTQLPGSYLALGEVGDRVKFWLTVQGGELVLVESHSPSLREVARYSLLPPDSLERGPIVEWIAASLLRSSYRRHRLLWGHFILKLAVRDRHHLSFKVYRNWAEVMSDEPGFRTLVVMYE